MLAEIYIAGYKGVVAHPVTLTKRRMSTMADPILPHKEILINHKGGVVAVLVDAEDYPLLSRHSWYIRSTTFPNPPYAATTLHVGDGKQAKKHLKVVPMHQLIMGVGNIDHRDRNTLDNRKSNLRKATHQQNGWNHGKPRSNQGKPCSSKYKGVRYAPLRGQDRWEALLKHVEPGAHKSTGVMLRLGYFFNEDDAARAYNAKVKELRGEFAWLNPVPEYSGDKK